MSKITAALNKTQLFREKPLNSHYIPANTPENLNVFLITLAIIEAVLALLIGFNMITGMNFNQKEMRTLAESNKIQEKKINNLMFLINKNKNTSDMQTSNLTTRFNQDSKDITSKIQNLSSISSKRYSEVNESALRNNQKIEVLNKEITRLNEQLREVAAVINQGTAPAVKSKI